MKKMLLPLSLILLLGSGSARAWLASEFTQIANNLELVMQYAKQAQAFQTQLQQYQAQLKNLEQNPGAILDSQVGVLVDQIGKVMSAQNSIGGTVGKMDTEIAKNYGTQVMSSYADKFNMWTNTSRDTLTSAMRSAGMHRDAYATDASALKALFNQSQNSAGSVAAIQQLSAITTMQVQQSQKLGDLIATQNIASSNWMAANTSRQQVDEQRSTGVAGVPQPLQKSPKGNAYTPIRILNQ